MANLVVTSSGNNWEVDFGVYASLANVNSLKRSNSRVNLCLVSLAYDSSHIEVQVQNGGQITKWFVTYDSAYAGSEYLIVDSIDGVAPTTQVHLFNLINGLRG